MESRSAQTNMKTPSTKELPVHPATESNRYLTGQRLWVCELFQAEAIRIHSLQVHISPVSTHKFDCGLP